MPELHEAIFYTKLANDLVQCIACNRYCTIAPGQAGNCGVRKNINGKLYSLVYNKALTLTVDPIEKKPLFHFKPGTHCMSVSTYGCNFHCGFCQNASISQDFSEQMIEEIEKTTPRQIVEKTIEAGAEGIAYTYTDPTVFAEYALDTMKLARKNGLYNAWVSNGYMTRSVIDAIAPYLDAINIDLKGNARFYREVCGNADVEKVKLNIRYFSEKKIHTELTYLIIPGFNDNEKDIKEAAEFVAGIDRSMPLHFSRFFPMYKMLNTQQTPVETLKKAKKIAEKSGLEFVYIGNLGEEENTNCPKCKAVLVKRFGFSAEIKGLEKKGNCKKCGFKTNIVL